MPLFPLSHQVSCYPDVAVHRRGPADDLLVLACDGVWDVMTNREAVMVLKQVSAASDVARPLLDPPTWLPHAAPSPTHRGRC